MWREITIDCEVEPGLNPGEVEAARTLTVVSKCARCLVRTLVVYYSIVTDHSLDLL